MKIDPCPCVVSLKDGSNHTLFKFRDFLELVDQEMGMDAAKWLEAHVNRLEEAADYTQAKVETDLSSYEASLESNTRAFQDLREVLQEIHRLIMAPRVNKHAVEQSLINGSTIIKNQI